LLAISVPITASLDLAHEPAAGPYPFSEDEEKELKVAEVDITAMESEEKPGTPSVFTCPECNGTLWELHEGELTRFRCHVGHAFSIESMKVRQTEALESALWAALRSLNEKIMLERRLLDQARERNQGKLATLYQEKAEATEQHVEQIRQILFNL
jgi:two-component system chemotaxis response regulator CheB